MDFVDFILNLAGLLLWLNWRSERLDAAYRVPVISLAHAVRKASSSPLERWKALALLCALLVSRGIIYWQFGRAEPHTFRLDLVAIQLPFLSNDDHFWLTQLYSGLSFLFTLAFFYLALLLFSILNSGAGAASSAHRFVRVHLGRLDRCPAMVKWLLPGLAGAAFWMATANAFAWLGIVPTPHSFAELWQHSAVIGLGVYLRWQWVIVAVLLLCFINTYVYLGRLPVWEYIQTSGSRLLAPMRGLPLQAGKVDFAPIVAMAMVSAGAVLFKSGWAVPSTWTWMPAAVAKGVLPWLYQQVPF